MELKSKLQTRVKLKTWCQITSYSRVKLLHFLFVCVDEVKFEEISPGRELGQGTPDVPSSRDVELEPSSGLNHRT